MDKQIQPKQVSKNQIRCVFRRYYAIGMKRADVNRHADKDKIIIYKPTLNQYVKHTKIAFDAMGIEKRSQYTVEKGRAYIRSLEKQVVQGKLSPYTLKAKISALNKYAACNGKTEKIQTEVIRHAPKRGFNPKTLDRIIKAMPERYHNLMEIYRDSGMRASELTTLMKEKGTWYVKGKGGLIRQVFISPETLFKISVSGADIHIPVNQIQTEFNRAKKRLGIQGRHKGNSLHGVRHTWAKERFQELVKYNTRYEALKQVSRELGHSRPYITYLYLN